MRTRPFYRRGAGSLLGGILLLVPPVARARPATHDPLVMASDRPPLCPSGEQRQGDTCVTVSFGKRFDSNIYNLFGLRGSLSRVSGQDPAAGLSLVSEGAFYGSGSLLSSRLTHLVFLGGGVDGVEGGLGLDFAMGIRGRFGPHQGPFVRLGLRGHLLSNQQIYSSRVELPQMQIGYQLLRKRIQIEVAGRSGVVLTGRYNALGGRRPLGRALELGGYSALRFEGLQLELGWTRTEARSSAPDSPVDELSGLFCGIVSSFGICLDARYYRGDVRTGNGSRLARSAYLGLAIGGAAQHAR